MRSNSFTGRLYSDLVNGGQAVVDIELNRAGLSAMTMNGQVFEVAYEDCILRLGGIGRRQLFCSDNGLSLTICCQEEGFLQDLRRASLGLLDMQFERQLKCRPWELAEQTQVRISFVSGIGMIVLAVYLVATNM